MGKRINTAAWQEKKACWKINVQKDGKRRSFYSFTPGRNGQREANAKADAWLDENIDCQNKTVSALYEDFLKAKEQTTSLSNSRPMNTRYNNYIKPEIGHLKIKSLSEHHLQQVIDNVYSKKKLAAKSLKNFRADLIAFSKYCRKRKVSTILPEDLTIPSTAAKSKKNILQHNDIIKLFESDKTMYCGKEVTDDYINAYRFQLLSGLRPGELLGLQWTDIDFANNKFYIKRAINFYGEETSGKNDNANRVIGLTDISAKVLKAQMQSTAFNNYVFPISNQQHYGKRLKLYCEHNNITVISPYELRHTFVSIVKQLPEGIVKKIVGHSQNMDTFGTYGHELENEIQQESESMNAIFNKLIKLA